MSLTEEQTQFVDNYRLTNRHVACSARAGSGKTYTLCQLAEHAPPASHAFAFTNAVKDVLQAKLPSHVSVATAHSTFLRCVRNIPGYWRVNVDSKGFKYPKLIKEIFGQLKYPEYMEVKELIQQVRNAALTPQEVIDNAIGYDLGIDNCPNKLAEVLNRGITDTSYVDFTDMLYVPLIRHKMGEDISPPSYMTLLVDEAQDLSPLIHECIGWMNNMRNVFVGDPFQAIYGFAGADTASFQTLLGQFNCLESTMTRCFRVPNNILEVARQFVPDINSELPDGELYTDVTSEQYKEIMGWEQRTELFRTNASLIRKFLALRKNGIYPQLACTLAATKQVALLQKLSENNFSQKRKFLADGKIYKYAGDDMSQCIELLLPDAEADGVGNYDALLVWINEFAKKAQEQVTDSGIVLSTMHRAKGLEWENVIVNDFKPATELDEQEYNLMYVAVTRAKKRLVLKNERQNLSDF